MIMKKVLYVTANPKPEEKSYSLQVGRAFIEEYKKLNPQDEVTEIEVYDIELPLIDRDMLAAWEALATGTSFMDLSTAQQQKVARFNELTEQFVAADRYVFVTPMWNLAVPALMKAYLDTATVAGKTFKYTAEGPVGLLTNKKAVHIHASGGVYSAGPASGLEHADSYVKNIINFIGVTDMESIIVEGMAYNPAEAESIKQNAINKAITIAKKF